MAGSFEGSVRETRQSAHTNSYVQVASSLYLGLCARPVEDFPQYLFRVMRTGCYILGHDPCLAATDSTPSARQARLARKARQVRRSQG
jgi:hypothetical protein